MATNVIFGPQAQADAASTTENQVIAIDVLANDLGGSGKQFWSLNQRDLVIPTLPGQAITLASGATVWLENGQIKYDPGMAFNHLSAGDTATDTFTYAIRLANGAISYSTVAITITGQDDPVEGVVSDGYIAGATVFVDVNENGILDTGEDSTTSDSNGDFSISTTQQGALVAVGGTNIDTGLANDLVLRAPEGSTVINPLTTLVQALVDTGLTATEAETQVQTALGLNTSVALLSYDILAQPAGDPDALAAQKAATSIAAILNLADAAAPGSESSVLAELASAVLSANGSGSQLLLSDPETIETIYSAALPAGTETTSLAQSAAAAVATIESASSIDEVTTAQLNTITGTDGDDWLEALFGESTLLGLGGNDIFNVGHAQGMFARVHGGNGFDALHLPLLASLTVKDSWLFERVDDFTIRGTARNGLADASVVTFSSIEQVVIGGTAMTLLPVASTSAGQSLFGTYLRDEMIAAHANATLHAGSPGNDVLVGDRNTAAGTATTTAVIDWSNESRGMSAELNSPFNGPSPFTRIEFSDGSFDIAVGVANWHVIGSAFNDSLFSFSEGSDSLFGGGGNDVLRGDDGDDRLFGGEGEDMIFADRGSDVLNGGLGADTFVYSSIIHSQDPALNSDARGIDLIEDFEQGLDAIDLGMIDAISATTDQNDSFAFIGRQPFSGTAGELRYDFLDGNTIVLADVDGDGIADMQINLLGTINLNQADFTI